MCWCIWSATLSWVFLWLRRHNFFNFDISSLILYLKIRSCLVTNHDSSWSTSNSIPCIPRDPRRANRSSRFGCSGSYSIESVQEMSFCSQSSRPHLTMFGEDTLRYRKRWRNRIAVSSHVGLEDQFSCSVLGRFMDGPMTLTLRVSHGIVCIM